MAQVRQRNVALILARELAVNVTTPMWMWDEAGMLVYYNEPAAAIIGRPTVRHDPVAIALDRLATRLRADPDALQRPVAAAATVAP